MDIQEMRILEIEVLSQGAERNEIKKVSQNTPSPQAESSQNTRKIAERTPRASQMRHKTRRLRDRRLMGIIDGKLSIGMIDGNDCLSARIQREPAR